MAIRSTTTFAEVLALTGMTQVEAAEYLDVSLPTIRAYCRGAARTQPEPLAELWFLYTVIRDRREEGFLPAKAPDSVRRRLQVAGDMHRLIDRAHGSSDPFRRLRLHLGEEVKRERQTTTVSETS